MRIGGNQNVVVFGADWCVDCRVAKAWLRDNNVPFTDIDVDGDEQARGQALELAKGRRNIPVVVLPDGSVLVEPSESELASALLPNAI
ncbi:MAG: glutaredoxin family protein [Labedaea sp.]